MGTISATFSVPQGLAYGMTGVVRGSLSEEAFGGGPAGELGEECSRSRSGGLVRGRMKDGGGVCESCCKGLVVGEAGLDVVQPLIGRPSFSRYVSLIVSLTS